MKKGYALLTIFALAITPFTGLFGGVSAANVVAYIDLTAQPATAPSTIAQVPEVAASTPTSFYISYVTSATNFAAGDTVSIGVPSDFTSLALCSPSTTDADGDSTADGALTLSGNTFTYTFTAATTTATTTGVEFCFSGTTPSANGNYSISISDDNDSDYSAALIYVGVPAASADTNDVEVTAVVPFSMTLVIKHPTNTTNVNSCNLGTLNISAVNTCSYRIAAGTNLPAGMRVRAVAPTQLTDGVNNILNVSDGTVTAGSNEHGVTLTAGTGWTLTPPFDSGDDPITATETQLFNRTTTVDSSNTATWTTVTHRASIDSSTGAGIYSQIVTYRAYSMP
jgi:hypothetical protein